MNSFDSTISYFGYVSCFWQDLQDLFYWVVCIPFQYFTECVVSERLEWLPYLPGHKHHLKDKV
jgi:hypothetical protein